MLAVSDMEKSAAYYRKFFGMETRSKKPERIWFQIAKTRLGLQPIVSGAMPSIFYISFKVAGFDRKNVTEKLKKLGAEVVPADDKDAIRFKDPNGLVMELKA